MPKFGEKGAVFLIFIFLFAAVGIVGVSLVIKTFTNSAKKINQDAEVLSVALKSEYSNPFEKETQYVNPFSSRKNPFDELR